MQAFKHFPIFPCSAPEYQVVAWFSFRFSNFAWLSP